MASQYKFVQEPSPSLTCLICHDVASFPKQETNCGKIFCTSCLDRVKDHKCPNCRKIPQYFEDTKSDREIKDLVVECKNTESGCSWKGSLRDAPDHVTNSCEFTIVKCKHEDIGCKETTTRKRMKEHEEDDITHLPLLLGAVKRMREERNVATDNMKIIKLQNYQEHKRRSNIVSSETFYSHTQGYKMCLVVAPNGVKAIRNSHMSVLVMLLEGSHDSTLPWPLEGRITVTLLNQLQDSHHYEKTEVINKDDNIRPQSGGPNILFTDARYISHLSLAGRPLGQSCTIRRQYLLADTLHFKVSVETNAHKPWLNSNSSLSFVVVDTERSE